MNSLVFVTYELSPFTAGGIGRVIHNTLKSMCIEDLARTKLLLINSNTTQAIVEQYFPGVEAVIVDTEKYVSTSGVKKEAFSCDQHWHSFVVMETVHKLNEKSHIEYIEFPDWGGLGFCTIQEKKISRNLSSTTIAVKLHSTHAVLCLHDRNILNQYDAYIYDLERKSLRDCDLIIGQLEPVAEETRKVFGFTDEEWSTRLIVYAAPVYLEANSVKIQSIIPDSQTPIIFGSKIQGFKRPDIFIRGASIYGANAEEYNGNCLMLAHSYDSIYRQTIDKIISKSSLDNISIQSLSNPVAREELIQNSIFVVPSDFESFCLAAYEASMLGAIVILNENNPAFGDNTPWIDGKNCLKFKGNALSLAQAIKKAFSLRKPLEIVAPARTPAPWCYSGKVSSSVIKKDINLELDHPLVTVIIPHFNMGEYILETVSSVKLSTYKNLEIIIVDDGSNDAESRSTISALEKSHIANVKVIRSPSNLGLAGARNYAISMSSGEYILSLDADDIISPTYIESAVKALILNPEYDCFITQASRFSTSNSIDFSEKINQPMKFFIGESFISGIKENTFSTASAVFRRSIFSEYTYDESMILYEDWLLFRQLITANKRFLVSNKVDFFYRLRTNSMVQAAHDPLLDRQCRVDVMRKCNFSSSLSQLWYMPIFASESTIGVISSTMPGTISPRKALKALLAVSRVKYFLLYPFAKYRRRYRRAIRDIKLALAA